MKDCTKREGEVFSNEEALTRGFGTAMSIGEAPFRAQSFAYEFDYREGRTDFVASDYEGDLFAFEMKLIRWRDALNQAYRNSSFAHFSYVVLPASTAKKAIRSRHEFIKRGVGLCSIVDECITVEIPARRVDPLRPWLTESAIQHITTTGELACV